MLPHLSGVPHLHINRPWVTQTWFRYRQGWLINFQPSLKQHYIGTSNYVFTSFSVLNKIMTWSRVSKLGNTLALSIFNGKFYCSIKTINIRKWNIVRMRPLTVVIKIDNYIPSFCRSINGIIRNEKNIPHQVKVWKNWWKVKWVRSANGAKFVWKV